MICTNIRICKIAYVHGVRSSGITNEPSILDHTYCVQRLTKMQNIGDEDKVLGVRGLQRL